MVNIKKCAYRDIKANPELVAEYATCALDGLPTPKVQWERYDLLEAAGVLDVFGAYCNGVMIGFVSTLSQVSMHYGQPITITESFYVLKDHRRGGAGVKLLRAVEQLARYKNSAGILITAPDGEALDTVLASTGYRPSHKVYFKGLGNE